jgi:Carboxypeptidase regulatory-like domain
MLARAVFLGCLAAAPGAAWAASVSGTITYSSGGAAVVGYEVRLLSESGGKGWVILQQTTTTNFSGRYQFAIVPPGDYIVQAAPAPHVSPQCFLAHRYYDVAAPNESGRVDTAADVLTLAAATVITGIDITIDVVGAFEATVTQGSSGLGGIQVRVENFSDGRIRQDRVTNTAGSVGLFTVCGLDPGQYRLWIHDPNALYEDRLLPGPYVVTAGAKTTLGNLGITPIASDPYEPNSSPASGTSLPEWPLDWESSGAIITPRGSDVDFYCFDALAGDRYFITTTTELNVAGELRDSPWVDPMLGWFATSPGALLLSNDDDPSGAGQLNARLDTGVVSADGRYCVAVTTYGDPDFNGSGQLSSGRYGLRVVLSDTIFADGFE